MAIDNKIVAIFPPTLPIKEMSVPDYENDPSVHIEGSAIPKPSTRIGYVSPYIMINGLVFDHTSIEYLEIKEDDFLPEIYVIMYDVRGMFNSAYFPKNDVILSLYIKSNNDKLKCIRNDFVSGSTGICSSSPQHGSRSLIKEPSSRRLPISTPLSLLSTFNPQETIPAFLSLSLTI